MDLTDIGWGGVVDLINPNSYRDKCGGEGGGGSCDEVMKFEVQKKEGRC